jgi:hypothetical protein
MIVAFIRMEGLRPSAWDIYIYIYLFIYFAAPRRLMLWHPKPNSPGQGRQGGMHAGRGCARGVGVGVALRLRRESSSGREPTSRSSRRSEPRSNADESSSGSWILVSSIAMDDTQKSSQNDFESSSKTSMLSEVLASLLACSLHAGSTHPNLRYIYIYIYMVAHLYGKQYSGHVLKDIVVVC